MKVNIESREKNPLLDRKELEGTVEHTGEATPSEEELTEFLSEELNTDVENIEVDKIFTLRGRQKSRFWAKEKVSREEMEVEETEEAGEDYGEILSGTISEGKEEIKDMENPDYEKLLEVEKNNKDRKGMKKYIEKEMGE